MNARAVAATVLVAVETDDARSQEALSSAMEPGADPRDRALATELVYGVLRWQRRLDAALAPLVKQGLERLEPIARALLRVGAYQILRLDRIPAPIAVSATQDAARQAGAARITGLLNAVLRRVAKRGERLPKGDDDRSVALRTSLPTWVVRELRATYGDDGLEREAEALRERATTTVRPTLGRGGAEALVAALGGEGFHAEPGPHGTLTVTGAGDPFATRAFADGLFVPQDPASLAVVELLGPAEGLTVLDLCAGRGIKATALADRGATVTAVDISRRKLDEGQALADKLGVADAITWRVADASEPVELGEFDRVLVDAPCSGLGTLKRHPEIAWRRRPEDLPRLAELQAKLVATGAAAVRPGGELVYAVCTFTRIEGAPAVPSGLAPAADPLLIRPSSGMDAFQARRWRRTSS